METSDGIIYFTARFYRRSKVRANTLDELGTERRWRIRPDGSGLAEAPKKKQTGLPTFHRKVVSDEFPSQTLDFIDTRTKKTTRVADVIDVVSSPDGRWLYILRDEKPACFLELATGRQIPAPRMFNVTWLDDGTLWGDGRDQFEGNLTLFRGKFGSTSLKRFTLRPEKEAAWVGGITDFYARFRRWRPLPQKPSVLIAETEGHMSDGSHFDCVLCDIKRRTWRPLSRGRLVGISPDGARIATAEQEWIGEYKRGGARCGPLEIVTIATGKRRAITTDLVSIESGDWR